ncbi:hypothetical protein HDU98_001772 [Podochytrium sp. JEL0797]|nr:hypothetical protein HDU98_001772 [Podochytrium sp. JEL0797]
MSPTVALVRHAQSMANVADRICSWPENGTLSTEGLSDVGKAQIATSALEFTSTLTLPKDAAIKLISSDFTRARETAEIILTTLQAAGFTSASLSLDVRLRERFFGGFEGKSGNDGYPQVWESDSRKVVFPGTESPIEVADRSVSVVREILNANDCELAFFVAHGDTLQIMQTQAKENQMSPWDQRKLVHFENAQIKVVEF